MDPLGLLVLLVLPVLEDLYLLVVLLVLLLRRDQLVLEVRFRHQALEGQDYLLLLEVLEVQLLLGVNQGQEAPHFLQGLVLLEVRVAHRLLFLL